LSRTQALSIKHYYTKYGLPEFPPSWMVFENVCFGMVSTAYAYLHVREQKIIASAFSLHASILKSWLQSLAYVRNLCAHHMRLWNRIYTIKPRIAHSHKADLTPNDRFYAQACIIQVFLKTILKDSSWAQCLKRLFDEYPDIPQEKMSFPLEWWKAEIWQQEKGHEG
jgi:abortive infection bacteriophage resistance protein